MQGALANLGHKLARNTIANILKRHGIAPAPERSRRTTWKDFLRRHLDQIVATNFFTVEVWTCTGLQRFIASLYGSIDPTRRTRWHRSVCEWIMDEPDCPQSNECR